MSGCCQITTTIASAQLAEQLADLLVAERLAACVQVMGPVRSTYRWNGAVEQAAEWLMIAKTTEARLPDALARIRELHPYQTPELVATAILAGDPDYLEWVRRETTPLTPETR